MEDRARFSKFTDTYDRIHLLQYFTAHVQAGQKVKKGDLLISFDLDAVRAAGYLCTRPLIVCNTDDYAAVRPLADGSVAPGQDLLRVE